MWYGYCNVIINDNTYIGFENRSEVGLWYLSDIIQIKNTIYY